jgi:hypothetical protein
LEAQRRVQPGPVEGKGYDQYVSTWIGSISRNSIATSRTDHENDWNQSPLRVEWYMELKCARDLVCRQADESEGTKRAPIGETENLTSGDCSLQSGG